MSEHTFKQTGINLSFPKMLEALTLVPYNETLEPELLVSNDWHNTQFLSQLSQTLPSSQNSRYESKSPLSILIAYSSEDIKLLPRVIQLLVTLQEQGNDIGWQSNEIHFNRQWENMREDYLSHVDLILLLITPAFIASKYCYCKHLAWAISQHNKRAYIMPILLRACIWEGTPFAQLSTITPNNRRAVDEWTKSTRAFKQIGIDIRDTIEYLQARR
jgi:TIR domain